MDNFNGTIIEESLEDKSILDKVRIISTKVEPINDKHQTPWVKQWTLHKVEIDEGKAEEIAELISKSLDRNHLHSWYADYKNEDTHYIIFRYKVFKIDRTNESQYNKATKYGIDLGIPDYQVNFAKSFLIKK